MLRGIPVYLIDSSCPYYDDRQSLSEYFTSSEYSASELEVLLTNGFRHFGSVFFRPACASCSECIPYRVLLDQFSFGIWQKRVMKGPLVPDYAIPHKEQAYSLYCIHKTRFSGSEHESFDEFCNSFFSGHHSSRFLSFYEKDTGRLACVCHYDDTPQSLSAVYTYYDHTVFGRFSPGSLAILTLAETGIELRRKYLYLGYYVPGNRHMSYKSRFFPSEIRTPSGFWKTFRKNDSIHQ